MHVLFAKGGLHVHELFLVGTFWFWLFLGLFFAAVTILTEYEKGFFAFLTVVLLFGLAQMFTNADILGYAWHHPFHLIGWVLGYFLGGVGWSLVKWRWYCSNQREKYDDLKADWLASKKVKDTKNVPATLAAEWEKYLKDKQDRYSRCRIDNLDMTLDEIKAGEGPGSATTGPVASTG
jgi:hypothetical protein